MPNSPTTGLNVEGSLVAHNAILNLLGQGVPLIAGFLCIPYLVHRLDLERFGVLSLGWMVLGYFTIFDLGLGRATTKFVAESLARNDLAHLRSLVWTSVGFQLMLGIAGSLLLMALTALLAGKIRLSPDMVGEAKIAFLSLAASLPFSLAGNAFRGVLEASQRFDLVNLVKIPGSVSLYLLPVIATSIGLHLPGIFLFLLTAKAFEFIAYLSLCCAELPILKNLGRLDFSLSRPLGSFGKWVTISNTVGPILTYVDRFWISAVMPVANLAYYTVPFDAISRISVIPGSLVATLFPAISSLDAAGARERVEELHARSVKALLLVITPILLAAVVFARDILRLWVGGDFATESTNILQILALGVLINCMAFVPFSLLQALGRPDLPAKFHLIELPIYLGMLWFLVHKLGMTGAALAWTIRVALDAMFLFVAIFWLRLASRRVMAEAGFQKASWGVLTLAILLGISMISTQSLFLRILTASALVAAFCVGIWIYVLDRREKSLLTTATNRLFTFGKSK